MTQTRMTVERLNDLEKVAYEYQQISGDAARELIAEIREAWRYNEDADRSLKLMAIAMKELEKEKDRFKHASSAAVRTRDSAQKERDHYRYRHAKLREALENTLNPIAMPGSEIWFAMRDHAKIALESDDEAGKEMGK